MQPKEQTIIRVAVVGACASGKSTLVNELRAEGYDARHIAQDHSFVPDMWQKIGRPDVLIYLDVNYENIKARRPKSTIRPSDLVEQQRRLTHAHDNCDLYIDTNPLTPDEILSQVLEYLNSF